MAFMLDDETIDLTKLRYVLYARRSSEDKNSQVRSLGDQIKECRQFAERHSFRIVGEPLTEKKSAKRSGQRVVFTQMLRDIETKKYDAILSWSPDRLSRNMLEGGKIIDLLDEGILKDVRFPTYHFTNDASGKLTLGVLFSISKHFSDELSRKVTRGIKGNLSEGKSSGQPKWGYDRADDGWYYPNKFFDTVQEAWYIRADGSSYDEVAQFLLDRGYQRVTKDKKVIKPTKNAVAKMFKDPFYYGLLIQAKQTVDLRLIYDFEPMIDDELFNRVQALGYGRTRDRSDKKRKTFFPLYGFVYCAVCNSDSYMVVGKNLPGGSSQHVLSYRCDNPNCTRKPKSLRAKHIFNSITDMLERFELTDEAYERYSHQIETMTDAKIIQIKHEVQSKKGALAHIKHELEERSLAITRYEEGSTIHQTNERRIEELASQQADLGTKINELSKKVENPQQIKLSKDEFLNVLKTAPDKMRAGSAVEKDVLCRILFLNLRVDNEKVASYLWREPFASLVKATEIFSGGGGRN